MMTVTHTVANLEHDKHGNKKKLGTVLVLPGGTRDYQKCSASNAEQFHIFLTRAFCYILILQYNANNNSVVKVILRYVKILVYL